MAVVLRRMQGQRQTAVKQVLAGAMGAIALIGAGSSPAAERSIYFDIPAEPLDLALGAFGSVAQTQLLFDAALTEGRRGNPLLGNFTPEVALRRLLAGTGIASRAIEDQGFTLALATPTASAGFGPDDVSASVRRFGTYSALVQETMHRVLCRHETTAPGADFYRVLVRVWVAASGLTDRAELLTSSGDERRDAALAASFGELAFEAPPPGLPQPITLLITTAEAKEGSHYCTEPPRPGREREVAR